MELSQDQINEFHERGYLFIPNCFTLDEAKMLNDEAKFVYNPVTPKESSSGTYSGGSPRKGAMTPAQVSELKRWVQQLKDDSANHAEQRGMGTGAIHRTTSDGEDDFIVKRSPALKDFEAFLAVFRAP